MDTHEQMNTTADANDGFNNRRNLLEESKILEFVGMIHTGLFKQERLLFNHLDLKIVLARYPDEFSLMTPVANNVKIEIVDAWLMVRRNTLASHKANGGDNAAKT